MISKFDGWIPDFWSLRKVFKVVCCFAFLAFLLIWNSLHNKRKEKITPDFYSKHPDHSKFHVWSEEILHQYGLWNYRDYSTDKIQNLSILGRRLFLNLDGGQISEKNFTIYVHEFGKRLERRLMRGYGSEHLDPFSMCSVKNCNISYDLSSFAAADAVLFHLHLMTHRPDELKRLSPEQIWVWLSDESPYNTLFASRNKNLSQFDGYFNWSMTYRSSSDVPVPYGRTVPLNPQDKNSVPSDEDIANIFHSKSKAIAVMGSNCGGRNFRHQYIHELQKYINVDYYGGCGTMKCPGHFTKDCSELNDYKFYLSFENSNCEEYITEKVWWNALQKKSVPVVLGSSRKQYEELLPPQSFIFVEDFDSPKILAEYMRYLLKHEDAYTTYHKWRKMFAVVNEHGYFQTPVFHYCRLCEALNYNLRIPKSYNDMKSFWDPGRDCYAPKWTGK